MATVRMKQGGLYKITYQQQSGNGQWARWQMTAVYLGWNAAQQEWQFSLRPLMGTTSLSKRSNPIEKIELIELDVGRRYPNGVRDKAVPVKLPERLARVKKPE